MIKGVILVILLIPFILILYRVLHREMMIDDASDLQRNAKRRNGARSLKVRGCDPE
jgi:hypothetical protein